MRILNSEFAYLLCNGYFFLVKLILTWNPEYAYITFYDVLDNYQYTPLSWCCKHGSVQMVIYFLNIGVKPIQENKNTTDKLDALEWIIKSNDTVLLSKILNHKDFIHDYELKITCLSHILKFCFNDSSDFIFNKLIVIFNTTDDEFYLKFASLSESIEFLKFIFLKIHDKQDLEKLLPYIKKIMEFMMDSLRVELLDETANSMPFPLFCDLLKNVDDIPYKLLVVKILQDTDELSRFKKIEFLLNINNSFVDNDILYEILINIDSNSVLNLMHFFVDFLITPDVLDLRCIEYLLRHGNVAILCFFLTQNKNILLKNFSTKSLITFFIENDVIDLSEKLNLILNMNICSVDDLVQCSGYNPYFLIVKIARNISCRGFITEHDLRLFEHIFKEHKYEWDRAFDDLILDGTIDIYRIFLSKFEVNDAEMFHKFLSLLMQDIYIVDFENKLHELLFKYWNVMFKSRENQEYFINLLLKDSNNSMVFLYSLIGWLSNNKICISANLQTALASRLDDFGIYYFFQFFYSSDNENILQNLLSTYAFKQLRSFLFMAQKTDGNKDVLDCANAFADWNYLNDVVRSENFEEDDFYNLSKQLFAVMDVDLLEKFLSDFNADITDSLFSMRTLHIACLAADEWCKKFDSCHVLEKLKFLCKGSSLKLMVLSKRLESTVELPKCCYDDLDMCNVLHMVLLPYNHDMVLQNIFSRRDSGYIENFLNYANNWFRVNIENLSKSEINSLLDFTLNVCEFRDKNVVNKEIAKLSDKEMSKVGTPLVVLGVLRDDRKNCVFIDGIRRQCVEVLSKNPRNASSVLYDCLRFGIKNAISSNVFDEFLSIQNIDNVLLQDFSLEIKNKLDKHISSNYFRKIIRCCNNDETLLYLLIKCDLFCKIPNIKLYNDICKYLIQLCFDKRNFSLLAHIMLYSDKCYSLVHEMLSTNFCWSHFGHCLEYEMLTIMSNVEQELEKQSPLSKILLVEKPDIIRSHLVSPSLYDSTLRMPKYRVQIPSLQCRIMSLATFLMLFVQRDEVVEFNDLGNEMISVNFSNYGQSFIVSRNDIPPIFSLCDSSDRNILENIAHFNSLNCLTSLIVCFGNGLHDILKDNSTVLNEMDDFTDCIHFRVLEQGGVKSLCDFLNCVVSHRVGDAKSKAIKPNLKSRNNRGCELLSVLYEGFQKDHYSKKEKSYYSAMKTVCFFYDVSEIWKLNLSFSARLHIAWCFFYPVATLKSFVVFVADSFGFYTSTCSNDIDKQKKTNKEIVKTGDLEKENLSLDGTMKVTDSVKVTDNMSTVVKNL